MSERAWDWAWRRRGLTPTRRLVLLALAEYAEDNGETCMPAPWLLRRMTGLSRRGVAKTLNALEAAGLIASEPGGCDGATRYWLLLDRPGSAMNCPGAKREDGSNDGP